MQKMYWVQAQIPNDAIASLARKAADDPDFDHRNWSLWNAESFELLASMIRRGYEQEKCEVSDE